MRITIDVESVLITRLTQLTAVVNTKNTMPILADIVMKSYKTIDGKINLLMTASDGEIWVSEKTELVSELSDENVSFAVNASDFLLSIKNLMCSRVEIEVDKEKYMIKAEYETGFFSLPIDREEDFPKPFIGEDERIETSLSMPVLLRCIEATEFAVGDIIIKPVLSCINFSMSNRKLSTASTDEKKLSMYSKEIVDNDCEFAFNLPLKACKILKVLMQKGKDNVSVSVGTSNIILSCSEYRLVARLYEGKYPPVARVVAQPNTMKVTANVQDLMGGLKRVVPMSNMKSELVIMTFNNGNLKMKAQDVDFSKSAEENIACDYHGEEEFTICVKGSYFSQILAQIETDNVILNMSTPKRLVLINPEFEEEGEKHDFALMPMVF